MRIGVLANESGVSRDTIRYYEKLGLLGKIEKSNTYKVYGERALRRLSLIKLAKNMGFTLHEIMQVMDAWETDGLNTASKKTLLTDKLSQLETKLRELKQLKKALQEILLKVNQECVD